LVVTLVAAFNRGDLRAFDRIVAPELLRVVAATSPTKRARPVERPAA